MLRNVDDYDHETDVSKVSGSPQGMLVVRFDNSSMTHLAQRNDSAAQVSIMGSPAVVMMVNTPLCHGSDRPELALVMRDGVAVGCPCCRLEAEMGLPSDRPSNPPAA